jgi:hypothetical protein
MTNKYQVAIGKQFKVFLEVEDRTTVYHTKVMKAVLTTSKNWYLNLQAWKLEGNEAWTM